MRRDITEIGILVKRNIFLFGLDKLFDKTERPRSQHAAIAPPFSPPSMVQLVQLGGYRCRPALPLINLSNLRV